MRSSVQLVPRAKVKASQSRATASTGSQRPLPPLVDSSSEDEPLPPGVRVDGILRPGPPNSAFENLIPRKLPEIPDEDAYIDQDESMLSDEEDRRETIMIAEEEERRPMKRTGTERISLPCDPETAEWFKRARPFIKEVFRERDRAFRERDRARQVREVEHNPHCIQVDIIETGKKIRFHVKGSDTIRDMKLMLQNMTGIPHEDMQIFRPQQMRFSDDQTLRELNLLELSENLFLVHTGKK